MIYSIVGTNITIREQGLKELKEVGQATRHMYAEESKELESFISATSLFDMTSVVVCIQFAEDASSKEEMIRLLPEMQSSSNIFIIDEPFADIHLTNKLLKVSKKVFDAREKAIKDDSIFKITNSFIARDKKQAWLDFLDITTRESGESIQGVIWWKFQIEWQRVKEGKRSLFTVQECERIGGDLVRSRILAHRGERDLSIELERIILSL